MRNFSYLLARVNLPRPHRAGNEAVGCDSMFRPGTNDPLWIVLFIGSKLVARSTDTHTCRALKKCDWESIIRGGVCCSHVSTVDCCRSSPLWSINFLIEDGTRPHVLLPVSCYSLRGVHGRSIWHYICGTKRAWWSGFNVWIWFEMGRWCLLLSLNTLRRLPARGGWLFLSLRWLLQFHSSFLLIFLFKFVGFHFADNSEDRIKD